MSILKVTDEEHRHFLDFMNSKEAIYRAASELYYHRTPGSPVDGRVPSFSQEELGLPDRYLLSHFRI